MEEKTRSCKKYCSILGAHFAMAPLSFLWIYGNLMAYMDSFFQFACPKHCLDAESPWILAMYVAGQFPGMFLVKPLVQKLGVKWAGMVTMVISNVAVLASAWSMQVSVAWTAVIYGIIVGPCVGMCISLTLHVISGWTPEWTALYMSTVSCFPTALSVLQNQLITAYVNPENLAADAKIGRRAYFSEPEILDRVPSAVRTIAFMSFGLQLLGYILIFNPPKPSKNTAITGAELAELNREAEDHEKVKSTELAGETFDQDRKSYGSTEPEPTITPVRCYDLHNGNQKHRCAQRADAVKEETVISWTPSQVLLSSAYYAILLFGVTTEYSLQIKANFYKQFAQIYIHDDNYLTLIGSIEPIVSTLFRIVFGALVDKHFLTLKEVIIVSAAVNSILSSFWYVSPAASAVSYLFIMLGLSVAHNLLYVIMFCAAIKLFGPDHLFTNFGLTTVYLPVGSFLTPTIVHPVLDTLGWFWLFTSCSVFSLLTLVFVVATSFDTQRRTQ